MTKFKTNGYELNRNSENKVFTHAVIYKNLAIKGDDNIGANFHSSLEKAQAEAKKLNKYSHIEIIEIVEVAKVGA